MSIKNTTHVDRVNRIKNMIKNQDANLPSWSKLFKGEYEFAMDELMEERRKKIDNLLS
jgi:hypothetical protein